MLDQSEGGIRVFFQDLIGEAIADIWNKDHEFAGKYSETGDLAIITTWRMKDDPSRPNKRAKEITVIFRQDALREFKAANDEKLHVLTATTRRILRACLHDYKPDFEPEKPLVITIGQHDL